MKGIPGKATKGLPIGARLDCVDNTGAKILEIVMTLKTKGVHRRYPTAGIGEMVVVSVRKGSPEMKRQLMNAVIVRQKRGFRRPDGTIVEFEDNAAVIVTQTGETKGSMIKGPVALEAAERWPKIASAATMMI